MNKTSAIACLLAALLIPTISQAKPKGLEKFDTDGNGSISKAEAESAGAKRLIEHFDQIDQDGNGDLTKEELRAHRETQGNKHNKGKIKEADTDQNGALSYDEATNAGLTKIVENFTRIDTDGNGEISREEMRSVRKTMKKKCTQAKEQKQEA